MMGYIILSGFMTVMVVMIVWAFFRWMKRDREAADSLLTSETPQQVWFCPNAKAQAAVLELVRACGIEPRPGAIAMIGGALTPIGERVAFGLVLANPHGHAIRAASFLRQRGFTADVEFVRPADPSIPYLRVTSDAFLGWNMIFALEPPQAPQTRC